MKVAGHKIFGGPNQKFPEGISAANPTPAARPEAARTRLPLDSLTGVKAFAKKLFGQAEMVRDQRQDILDRVVELATDHSGNLETARTAELANLLGLDESPEHAARNVELFSTLQHIHDLILEQGLQQGRGKESTRKSTFERINRFVTGKRKENVFPDNHEAILEDAYDQAILEDAYDRGRESIKVTVWRRSKLAHEIFQELQDLIKRLEREQKN